MAVNFDINSFVIDHPTRAISLNSDDTIAWYTNQIQDFSVKVDGEEETKKDANGNTIATITRGKTCTVNFNVAVFDLNIIAAQNGTKKEVAGADVTSINAPIFEEIKITADNQEEIVLRHKVRGVGGTYKLNVTTLTNDGAPKKIFKQGAAAAEGVFTYADGTKTVSFYTGDLSVGDTVLIVYEYDAKEAVRVAARGTDFPKSSKLYIELRGFDVCDQNTLIYAYYRFPNAKLKSSYQDDLKLDSTIPMEFDCAVDYCGEDKNFYDLVVPNSAEA